MEALDKRRLHLCLKFAKNCLKVEKVLGMFNKKTNINKMKTIKGNLDAISLKKGKYYTERKIITKRYQKSPISTLTKLLK